MLNRKHLPYRAALVALAVSAIPLVAQDSRIHGEFSRSFVVDRPVSLELANANGRTTIRTGADDEVRVLATISAGTQWDCDRSDSERKVGVFETQHAFEYRRDVIRIGHWADPEMGHCTSVEYDVEVPAGTPLVVDHRHGSIEVFDVAASMTLSVEFGGQVHVVRPGGEVVATGTGAIEVAGPPRGDWMLETETGPVTLHVPDDAAFELDAEVEKGWIDSNVLIGIREGGDGTVLRGVVNGGGPTVRLRSGYGLIRIEESADAGSQNEGR